MFCNNCGIQNPDTAKFCSECGTKFNHAPSDIPPAKPAPEKPVETKNTVSIEEKLATLSTANLHVENKTASRTLDPIDDPYWDDVLPEIDNEIYAIPKDNIIKVAVSIFALFAVIVWLIYML